MAGDNIFPQIPSTVWKGVWSIFYKSPSRKLDENVLSAELNVQKTAARQYINELTRLKIIESSGSPTELASRWRQDGDDPQVIMDILKGAYPQTLLDLAPPDNLDRDKIVRWFLGQNLGEGAAKNKAATYIRIASGVSSSDSPRTSAPTESASTSPKRKLAPTRPASSGARTEAVSKSDNGVSRPKRPDLNVNIQIHISADASPEQIDSIFSAMSKYFD